MNRVLPVVVLASLVFLSSCAKKESEQSQQPAPTSPAAAPAPAPNQPPGGPHVTVHLKDGTNVPGKIVASSQTDMVVAADNGTEQKIPLQQVKSVSYTEPSGPEPGRKASPRPTPQTRPVPAPAPAAPRPVTTKTYELPEGSELSVRTNETIDSETAQEGQTFDAQVTRDATDANGDVVIPRGSDARIVIKSASKGGRFKGASDLVLDLQSVVINGRTHSIETADITKQGKSGVGINKRTAIYAGSGAAVGAIIGAIAGGGRGAAIGAASGAGAGVLTEVLTKGGSIKVPVESVLTFRLDRPLRVRAQ